MSPPTKTQNTDPTPTAPPGTMRVADVAKMWGVQPGTVSQYMKESKQLVGSRPGRYANNPVPRPDGYTGASRKGPWWTDDRREELNVWFNSRLGLAHGTGGRRSGSKKARG
jgi:hypothetical protein